MKYKVGDKVRIKPKFHFCSVDGFNNIHMKDEFFNEYSRLPYCETVMTIGIVNKDFYILKEDRWAYKWTDEMIEGLVEEESEKKLSDESWRYKNIFDSSQYPQSFECPDGYIFKDENGNVINATKIVCEKKKKEYPKTYEECCKVMNYCCNPVATKTTHKEELIRRFQFLLLYRDAYWKIAGEEMGLGKPWEPSKDKMVYSIYRHSNKIETDMFSGESVTFEFPTKEMRDAFFENFNKDIEICKEFL